MKTIGKIIIQVLNILFIILSFVLVYLAIFHKELFETFIEWMKGVVDGLGDWNYLIIFISALIEAFPVLGILVPGQNILLIVGGFFAGLNPNLLVNVVVIATIGGIAGNQIGYILGRYFGDGFFKKYGIWLGIGQTEVKYLKKGIDTWGPLGITFGKFHGLTRSFLPFIAGSMKMKPDNFMIYNALGSFLWAFGMILLGVVFVQYYQFLIDYSGTISLCILLGTGGYVYFYKKEAFIKYWNEKNAEIDGMVSKDKN